MTYKEILDLAIIKAESLGKETEGIKFLLFELSGLSSAEFYLKFNNEVNDELKNRFFIATDKYLIENIPIQHILGYSYFYGRKFTVNNNSFIPRNETEELVENILIIYDEYFKDKKVNVIDLGTGSGAIGITLALEEPEMNVTASDISDSALKVAKENANVLNANVKFIESDLFSNIEEKFDIIVSNPPYIPDEEILDDIVKKDPALALFGGTDGTEIIESILKNASEHLNDYGLIAFEHGYDQSKKIHKLASKYIKDPVIKTIKDLSDKDRITLIGIGGVLS